MSMELEKDEIGKQTEATHLAIEIRFGNILLVLIAFYLGAWLLHWFFHVPSSMIAVSLWSIVIGVCILLRALNSFMANFLVESRLRSQRTDQQLAALESRVTALSKSVEKCFTGTAGALKEKGNQLSGGNMAEWEIAEERKRRVQSERLTRRIEEHKSRRKIESKQH